MAGVTPVRMVGSKKVPPRAWRLPPVKTCAPLPVASAICSSILAMALSSISGPCVTPSSTPLPTFSAFTASASFCANASYTPACTNKRLAHTQVWPLLRYLEPMAPCTAASRSASSNTINGALPPSSIDIFLMVGALCSISLAPTSVLPVKVILRTMGLAVSSPPISVDEPVSTLKMPAGTPARSASTASASADSGVCVAGFSTIGQPAASAGPTLRVIIAAGKFHGVIAAVTPIGCFNTRMRRSLLGGAMMSPSIRRASSANHSI
ncbi:hypothetical protein WG78_16810 [Amantichitinum ursilacus]|uniref:Uncharacterized protein n=1 Tax=Amantichitinum ursilacus TaxID=857265 RepID=A0A0N0GM47_9NEIS|nr:hypothetical protein WG78_16810 [Amantichitinum ursilacus]